MGIVLAGLGIALITVVFVDLVQTTLTVDGGGWLSGRLARRIWRSLLRRHRRRPSHRLLARGGPAILLSYFLVWFMLIWVGWGLVFASGEASIVHSPTGRPADASDRLYFAGFTVITLGVGDYVPNGAVWQVLTVAASASGFFLVTLVITYVVPVLSAVVAKRQLAAQLHGLGATPAALLTRAWTGEDFTALDTQLSALTPQIHQVEKQHLAYPVLHYFHSVHRRSALPPAIGVLDESLALLLCRVPAGQRPADAVLGPLREAVAGLLGTLGTAFIKPSGRIPPPSAMPEWWPAEPEGEADRLYDEEADRRRLLLGWLEDDGWDWKPPASR